MSRQYDVVLIGATGFTGRLAFEYLCTNYLGENAKQKVAFAIAGRNRAKLKDLQDRVARKLSNDGAKDVPIIVADSHDAEALDKLAKTTNVVLSTVGPFLQHGSDLVAACVANGTSYCDITGESLWTSRMAKQHAETAKRNKCRIVSMCGLDCVPADIGAYVTAKRMKEAFGVGPQRINGYIVKMKSSPSGGTIASILNMLSQPDILQVQKEVGNPYELIPVEDRPRHRQPDSTSTEFCTDINRMTTSFFLSGVNIKTVLNTAYHLPENYADNFEYKEKICLKSSGISGWLQGQIQSLGTATILLMGLFSPTRELVRYFAPDPGSGLSEEAMQSGKLEMQFLGYKEGDAKDEPSARTTIKIHKDPGYLETAKMVTECALALSLNADSLPSGYGFLSPAAAMGDVLVGRLTSAGIDIDTDIVGEAVPSKEAKASTTVSPHL